MKLAYYKDQKWEQKWIDAAYKTVLAVYEEFYAPAQKEIPMEEDNDDDDDLFSHLYKRRHIERENELEKYLGSICVEGNIDLLI